MTHEPPPITYNGEGYTAAPEGGQCESYENANGKIVTGPAGRGVREKNMAWTEPETVPQGGFRGAGRVAAGTWAAQHLGAALHAAYWKYVARRRIEGSKRGTFALEGSNFFTRPQKGNATEAAWAADRKLLEREHRALRTAVAKVLRTQSGAKFLGHVYGVAFHDVYHGGQIRLLRRLQER